MEEYIKEALNQGYIRPSSSPAASSFFFMGTKDGGLRPCIDYRALNSQTTKLPYPLPLVPAALEELRGARIFSKLDLRSSYKPRSNPGGRWVEDGIHHSLWPLWIPRDAVWPFQCSLHLPGIHERGVPGVTPPLCDSVHRWHPYLLPEPGRPPPHQTLRRSSRSSGSSVCTSS